MPWTEVAFVGQAGAETDRVFFPFPLLPISRASSGFYLSTTHWEVDYEAQTL